MAAPTLQEMVSKGQAKLQRKAGAMKTNFDGAKPRAKTNYGAMPFGPQTKAAFNAGIDAAAYRAPDPAKWATNFQAGVSK